MKNNKKEHTIVSLAALLTFTVFAVGILSVLLGGAGVYQRLTQQDRISYDHRTCSQYMANKIRQAPGAQAVALSQFGDGDCLLIAQRFDGNDYVTRVYCHDGWLMELFTAADGDFSPQDGERILPLANLSITQNGSLLTMILTDAAGATQELTLLLREGEVAQP